MGRYIVGKNMKFIEKIKSGIGMKAQAQLFSVMGGLMLMLFWIYINQLKTEAKLPFWDIVDFANENEAEDTQEKIDNNIVDVNTSDSQSTQTITPVIIPVLPDNTSTIPIPIGAIPETASPAPAVTPTVVAVKPKIAAPKKPLGPYTDGNYTATSYTPWGDIGISMQVKNGKWSNIRYLSIPDSPPSQYASSYLAKQALQAQDANIDGVSGATYTSDAFRDDLSQIVQQSKV